MRSRLLRAFFTLAALTVVWLLTTPAFASNAASEARSVNASFAPAAAPAPVAPITKAPLCDPRGAITFASAPQMQEVEVSLDSGLTLDDCMSSSSRSSQETNHAAPGRAPLPSDASSASSDAAVITAVITLARSSRELIAAPEPSTPCSRPGFRSTVDRPPRV